MWAGSVLNFFGVLSCLLYLPTATAACSLMMYTKSESRHSGNDCLLRDLLTSRFIVFCEDLTNIGVTSMIYIVQRVCRLISYKPLRYYSLSFK